jgi:hypothetical protein
MPIDFTDRQPVVPAYITWGDAFQNANVAGVITFDAVLSEEHERDAEVTDHSVETGVAVTDHVRPLPNDLHLEVVVTNQPLSSQDAQLLPLTLDLGQPTGSPGFLGTGINISTTSPPPSQVTAYVLQFDGEHDYVAAALSTLTGLRDSGTILSVVTPRAFYANMVLKRIVMRRDRTLGSGGATFSLELRELRIVTAQIVDAPTPSIPRAAPVPDKGKQDAKPQDPAEAGSLLHRRGTTGTTGLPIPGADAIAGVLIGAS